MQPSVIYKQLEAWNLSEPTKNSKKNIYDTLYSKLSEEVYMMLGRADLGKFLLKGPERCFKDT